MKIWKYDLDMMKSVQAVRMPAGAKALSVGIQFEERLVLWAEVDPDKPHTDVWFYLVQTGKDIPDGVVWAGRKYIGTVQFWNGDYVLHIYEGFDPNV